MSGAQADRPFLESRLEDLSNEFGDRLALGFRAPLEGVSKSVVSSDSQCRTHVCTVLHRNTNCKAGTPLVFGEASAVPEASRLEMTVSESGVHVTLEDLVFHRHRTRGAFSFLGPCFQAVTRRGSWLLR